MLRTCHAVLNFLCIYDVKYPWNCTGEMNTIFPKDFSSVGVLSVVVKSGF